MKSTSNGISTFAGKPFALRRRVLDVLDHADLTAKEIAGFAYRPGRPICLHHAPACSTSQVECVRQALRVLVEKGRIVVLHRHRRRNIYGLARQRDQREVLGALRL